MAAVREVEAGAAGPRRWWRRWRWRIRIRGWRAFVARGGTELGGEAGAGWRRAVGRRVC